MTIIHSSHRGSEIHSTVREHYGRAASQNAQDTGCTSGCCAPDSTISMDAISMYYHAEDVAALPTEVTGLSMGCGDPVTLASLQPGEVVLDLGSGGGIDCFLAAQRVGEQGRVIGVDMTAQMLEKARANQQRLGATNVEFRLGEIEHLPVADNQVDVILSNCVINLSPDKPQVFREAYRVLKAGGRLSLSDIVTQGVIPEAMRENLESWATCVAGAMDIQEYITALEAAGFVDVQVEPQNMGEQDIQEMLSGCCESQSAIPTADSLPGVFSARITAHK